MDKFALSSAKITSSVLNKWKKQCSICGHRFHKLKMHMNSAHSGGEHRCKICPCAFHYFSGLEHHIRLKHADGKRNEFLQKKSLMRPTNILDQSKASASKLCKKAAISRLNYKSIPSSFPTKCNKPTVTKMGSRKSQSSRSRDIQVICEECGNIVPQKYLEHHLLSLHRGGRFVCNLCPCSSFNVVALSNHRRRHYVNKSQPIPTYLTQLKQQEFKEGPRVSSLRRSSSVEILNDKRVPRCRQRSCSPEISTTFCYEGSSLGSSRIVSFEPGLSDEGPTTSRNLPVAAVPPTNRSGVMNGSQLVTKKITRHQQRSTLTSSSATKKPGKAPYILMRAVVSTNNSLPSQVATGLDATHVEDKGNVSHISCQDSGFISEGGSWGELIKNWDFNGNSPEESLWDIRPSTGMQLPLQPYWFPTCHVCNTVFDSPAALAQHMKIHMAFCCYCGKAVPTLDIFAHMPNCASAMGMSNPSSSRQGADSASRNAVVKPRI